MITVPVPVLLKLPEMNQAFLYINQKTSKIIQIVGKLALTNEFIE